MRRLPATPRFGVYARPVHRPHQDPTIQLEETLALAEQADRLGLHEMWWGEHHGTSWRLVADPMLMVARAAASTHRIRLGAAVTVPSRHPKALIDGALQLDHLTRGRLLLGLSVDPVREEAAAAGLTTAEAQLEIREGVEAVTRLLRERAPLSMTARHAPWRLRDARLQLRPYAQDLDVRVTSLGSAPGPELAGRLDHGLVTMACSVAAGLGQQNRMAGTWQRAEAAAARHGTTFRRDRWAAVGPVHVAETEVEARRQVQHGLRRWAEQSPALPAGLTPDADADALVDALHAGGHGVVGTPAMAVDHIERVLDLSGGFGAVLLEQAGWSSFESTQRSLELFARAVVPQLTGAARAPLTPTSNSARAARARRRAASPTGGISSMPTPARGISRVHHEASTRPPSEPPRRRGRHALDPTAE